MRCLRAPWPGPGMRLHACGCAPARALAVPTRAAGGAPVAAHVEEPADPRLALYRAKRLRDHREYQSQYRVVAKRALEVAGLGPEAVPHGPLGKLRCVVRVHYSADCLGRVLSARQAGRAVLVDSVLLPSSAAPELAALAASVAPVYTVSDALYEAEFQREGSTVPPEAKSCQFAVGFPVPRPLAQMRPPFVVLDGLTSGQNVGQILRTAYHLGVTSVVASRPAWNNLSGRAARVSMGWMYHMDFHLADPLGLALEELRGMGVRIYAAENQFPTAVAPHEPAGERNWALVVGQEDAGVSSEALSLSDANICVPQRGGESLNVAHAAAICLYELSRHMAD